MKTKQITTPNTYFDCINNTGNIHTSNAVQMDVICIIKKMYQKWWCSGFLLKFEVKNLNRFLLVNDDKDIGEVKCIYIFL